ncbi:MAG: hypothetical protein ACREGI_00585, partial [Candidatus Levyibacteriota bacterium]
LFYRIPKKPEQLLRLLTHYSLLRQPISENIAFLRDLERKNQHNLFLISGRFGFLKKKTQSLITKHKLEQIFKQLHFNFDNMQPHEFKDRIIKELGIQRFVDDDLSLLRHVAAKNPQTHFFWLNKKELGKITENITAITHIADMLG